jgi:hypothetical protein
MARLDEFPPNGQMFSLGNLCVNKSEVAKSFGYFFPQKNALILTKRFGLHFGQFFHILL